MLLPFVLAPLIALRMQQKAACNLIKRGLIYRGTKVEDTCQYAGNTKPLRIKFGVLNCNGSIFLGAHDQNVIALEHSDDQRRMRRSNQLDITKCLTEILHN